MKFRILASLAFLLAVVVCTIAFNQSSDPAAGGSSSSDDEVVRFK